MPRCPQCQEISARRKNGQCPKCGIVVELRDKEWFLIGQSAPNIELLKHWEALLTERIGETFRLPRKSSRFFREAKFAHDRLQEAEGDLEVAKQALWIAFNDNNFAWKFITTLLAVEREWPALLVMARSIVKDQRRRAAAAQERYADLMETPYGLDMDSDNGD